MPPVGWPQFGHKGAGLAMMIEMLVGPLSHAGCTKGPGKGGQGVMVLAIDIEAFTDLDTYKEEVEGLRDWVCSARPLPGFKRVYAPGEIEEECRQKRLRDGIEVPEPTWEADRRHRGRARSRGAGGRLIRPEPAVRAIAQPAPASHSGF